MARSFNFAVIRFAPDPIRGESLNIGLTIFRPDCIDVRLTKKIERVRAISVSLDIKSLIELIDNMKYIDDENRRNGNNLLESRLSSLSMLKPLKLSDVGTFVANNDETYEQRIAEIMKMLVEPEPAEMKMKVKKTLLFSQIKDAFRKSRVLAQKNEGIECHRIVPNYQIDSGLVADLVLKNSSYHVVETVDATGDEHAFRRAISEIAMSALVLERARMKFGETATKAKLVFHASAEIERVARPSLDAAEHQGAQLVNWASSDDREKFLVGLETIAEPLPSTKGKDFAVRHTRDIFH